MADRKKSGRYDLCAFCPDLCLDRCPIVVASGSANHSPYAKMPQGWLHENRLAPSTEDMARLVYHCTGCLNCHEACKFHVDVEQALFDLRAELVREGVSPHPRTLFEVSADDLADAQAAVVPSAMFVPEAQAVLFAGCNALLKAPGSITTALSVFRKLGIEFVGASRDAAICCGYPLHAGGYPEAFAEQARRVVTGLRRYKLIVALAPCCAYAMRSLYAVAGIAGGPRVMLALDLVAPLVMRTTREPLGLRIAYHDSCFLGRHLGQYDAPRELLARVNGRPPIELRRNRGDAMCCGAGGSFDRTSPALAENAARHLLGLAADAGADVLATAGMPCSAHVPRADANGARVTDLMALIDLWLKEE